MGYAAWETEYAASEIGFLVFFGLLYLMSAMCTPGNGDLEEWYGVPLWYFMMYGSVVGAITMIIRLAIRLFS